MGFYGNGDGWANDNMAGFSDAVVIDANSQAQLNKLGFTIEEMNAYNSLLLNCGKVTPQLMSRAGIPYQMAQHIKYMADILSGKVGVSSEDDLVAHFKKMKLTDRKIGIYDLIASRDLKMKRKCLIAGLPKGTPFALYNSGKKNTTFNIVDVSGSNFTIISDIVPKLPYGHSKKLYRVMEKSTRRYKYYEDASKIPDEYKEENLYEIKCVAEILETNGEKVAVKVYRDYARMCGRFIIVGSLRCPDNHLGMVKIITLDGSRVYVFAKQTGWNEKEKYSIAKERIYDYGFDVRQIYEKLTRIGSVIYSKVGGVYGVQEPANVEFLNIEPYVDRSVYADIDTEYSEANNTKLLGNSSGAESTNSIDW